MEILKEVLKTIEKNGFKAYIVGGYVRDKLLHLHPIDVDICTSALEKDLMWMFKSAKGVKEYGAIKIKSGKYDIDITTMRKESNLVNGKPLNIEYTDSLDDDLKRRDFTINALVFDSDFKLIDKVDGLKDLKNKLIRTIGASKDRFDEDPLRILRALRFMTVLDFSLHRDIISYIEDNKYKLSLINYEKRKIELDKIFSSKNLYKFINVVKKYNLEEYLDIKINKVVKTGYSIGIWAQIEFGDNYNFTKVEMDTIKSIRSLVNKGSIDEMDLYENGIYISLIAAKILGIKKINTMYNLLPIKDRKEINITTNEICRLLNITPSKEVGEIIKELEKLIVYGKIENSNDSIKKYLRERSNINE